jgi:tRNA 2-thiouridine synthesizing protein A
VRLSVRHQPFYLIAYTERDATLDAKGLNCPLPILKARKALKDVAEGGVLEILATDPGSVADFEAFCRQTGNELLEHSEDGGVYRFLIKKAA